MPLPERIAGTNLARLPDGRVLDRGLLLTMPMDPAFAPKFSFAHGFGRWMVEVESPADSRGTHWYTSYQDETPAGLLRRLAAAIEAGDVHFPVPELPS